ncbi:MAG: hypothetical protein ACQET7_08775 [Thermodesulfobacteriota bacterium]
MRGFSIVVAMLFSMGLLWGCTTTGPGSSPSARVNARADEAMYQPVEYMNVNVQGPDLIVLPGQIKSNNATFTQRITANNIADFGELELSRANFRVLERTDLGPMLDEITLAANMGDPQALERFKRGKFKSTKWFVKFDILKAEPVAEASRGFDGAAAGSILGTVIGGRTGSVTRTGVGSVRAGEEAGIWVVGMRYKVLDASTTEQMATGYFEQKMEMGSKAGSVLGFSSSESQRITLDTMVQRLVQEAVQEIDRHK